MCRSDDKAAATDNAVSSLGKIAQYHPTRDAPQVRCLYCPAHAFARACVSFAILAIMQQLRHHAWAGRAQPGIHAFWYLSCDQSAKQEAPYVQCGVRRQYVYTIMWMSLGAHVHSKSDPMWLIHVTYVHTQAYAHVNLRTCTHTVPHTPVCRRGESG